MAEAVALCSDETQTAAALLLASRVMGLLCGCHSGATAPSASVALWHCSFDFPGLRGLLHLALLQRTPEG